MEEPGEEDDSEEEESVAEEKKANGISEEGSLPVILVIHTIHISVPKRRSSSQKVEMKKTVWEKQTEVMKFHFSWMSEIANQQRRPLKMFVFRAQIWYPYNETTAKWHF